MRAKGRRRRRGSERELTREITLPILLPIARTYAYAYGFASLPSLSPSYTHAAVHPRDPPPRFLEFFLRNDDASHQPWRSGAAVIHLTLPRNSRPAAAGLVLLMMACPDRVGGGGAGRGDPRCWQLTVQRESAEPSRATPRRATFALTLFGTPKKLTHTVWADVVETGTIRNPLPSNLPSSNPKHASNVGEFFFGVRPARTMFLPTVHQGFECPNKLRISVPKSRRGRRRSKLQQNVRFVCLDDDSAGELALHFGRFVFGAGDAGRPFFRTACSRESGQREQGEELDGVGEAKVEAKVEEEEDTGRRGKKKKEKKKEREGGRGKETKVNLAWRGPGPVVRPCRYPWISVGVLGTDGGHSACWYHFILSISSRGAFSSSSVILLPSPPHLLVPPSSLSRPGWPFSRRLLVSRPCTAASPSFSVALLFIYSFGPAAALCPSARRLVGRSLGRTFNVPASNTSAQGYTDLPRLPARAYLAGWRTPAHFGGPANFGYSHRQQRASRRKTNERFLVSSLHEILQSSTD